MNDDDVTHGIQKHYSSPQQTPIFGHGNEEEAHAPSIDSNTLRTRACKLLNVQSKTNKRMENKRKKLDESSSTIADAIKEISKGVKEIEKMKMEMTKRIVTKCFRMNIQVKN